MKTNNLKAICLSVATVLLFFVLPSVFTSCVGEVDEAHIKTFTGDQIYSALQKDTANYSEFVRIIDKAGYKGMLNAYGTYTCLAPTNSAIRAYYKLQGANYSIKDVSESEAKNFVKNHVIGQLYLTSNLSDGKFPSNNMNDRIIDVHFINKDGKLNIRLNQQIIAAGDTLYSLITQKDYTVANGVIQTINKVLAFPSYLVPDIIATAPDLKIFSEALQRTGLKDSLLLVEDKSYIPVLGYKDEYNKYDIPSPAKRKYGYTVFAESDDLLHSKGINTIDDLIAKTKEWYPNSSAENDYKNPNNSLNKFIAYHLVEKAIYANTFFYSSHASKNASELCEYTETMYHCRIFKSSSKNLINNTVALLNPDTENEVYVTNKSATALNGIIHYLSDILLYSNSVEKMLSSTRIRFDFVSLLPEMMNNNLRASNYMKMSGGDRFGIPPNYFKYMKTSQDTRMIYLAGTSNSDWSNYQGDEMMGLGNYDLTVRLLPVPPGTYEFRFGYSANPWRSVTQMYEGLPSKLLPIGIPLDLRITASDPRIGYMLDSDTPDNGVENDKAMRNRGYMKAPTSVVVYSGNDPIILRYRSNVLRRIVCVIEIRDYEPHYVRFKSVIENPDAQCMMDYFELVPKVVYSPPGGVPETRD